MAGFTDVEHLLEVGELHLHVLEEGEGQPVVFLHGFPDSSRLWRHQVSALARDGFRCIVPDLRGFGRSEKPVEVEKYALPLVLSDVTGIMDELDIDRAAVVGHDWGAVVGWLLASFIPERLEKLVAISVGHPGGFSPPFLSQLQKSWYILFFQHGLAEEALQRDDWFLFRVWLHGAVDTDLYLEDLARPGALSAGLNWYRANFPPQSFIDGAQSFPSIEVPVLGIWGAGDPYLTEELMERSASYVSGTWRYERFDDAGHWIPLDQPDRLSELVIEFLKAA